MKNVKKSICTFIILILLIMTGMLVSNTLAIDTKNVVGTFDIDEPSIYSGKLVMKDAKMQVKGWWMSNDSNAKIKIYVDGQDTKADVSKRTSRPDVLTAIKGYGSEEENPKPGFETTIDMSKYAQGTHEVKYRLETMDGKVLAEKTTEVEIKKGEFYIDSQYNVSKFEGKHVKVNGWIMTMDKTSKFKIYIDGEDTKTEFTRTERPDVITAVKGYGGKELNPTPGFEGILNLSKYNAGKHTVKYQLEQEDGTVIYSESYNVEFDNESKGQIEIENPNIYGGVVVTNEAILEIKGWIMTNDATSNLKVYVDGKEEEVKITSREERPDVISAIKGYGDERLNPTPGFRATVDISAYSQGEHKITYKLETIEGEVLAEKSGNIKLKKGEFYIDSQYNVSKFEGKHVKVNGWIMTMDKTSKFKIYIDGEDTKTEFTRTERPDVITAVKGYGGKELNPTPGFEGILNLSKYNAGKHTVKYQLEQEDGTVIYSESYNVEFDNESKGQIEIENPNIYGGVVTIKEVQLQIKGWIMTNDPGSQMKIYIDDQDTNAKISTRTERIDVIEAIKGYGGEELNPTPGFEMNIDLSKYLEGEHTITYELVASDGTTVIAQKKSKINIKRAEMYIDRPNLNQTLETTETTIVGWAMTMNPKADVKVLIDGNEVELKNKKRLERPDVIEAIKGYGGIENNPTPGFEITVDLSKIIKGNHKVTISVQSEDGSVLVEQTKEVYIDAQPRATLDIDEPNWKGVPNTDGKIIGWVMTNVKNYRIRVFIDQYEREDKQYRVERPDVIEAIKGYGGIENNPLPGFEIDMKYGDFALGTHTLKIVIQDENGIELAVKTVEFTIFDNSNGISDFPESYQIMLKKLVEEKGMTNWKFKPVYTGIDWNDLTSTSNENQCLKNLVHESSPSTWKCICGRYGDVSYVCASGRIVNYFLDPRNFLTQVSIFQFLDLSQNKVTLEQIEQNVEGTFLQDSVNGESYAQMLYEAQNQSGENALSIMSRIFQEIGRGSPGNPPAMVSGKNATYPNTYNFFNYGATDGEGNTLRGLKLADSLGWHDPKTALVEGAKLIANDYIVKNKQNTKYLFKFDVTPEGGLYNHQYMSNVEDPNSQASILFNAYNKGNLNSNLVFEIPIYDNMPAYVKLPSDLEGDLYYISSDYSSVGFRTGPGTNYNYVDGSLRLKKDSVVKMIQSGINGWAKVEYDGKIGYVSEEYLTHVNTVKD